MYLFGYASWTFRLQKIVGKEILLSEITSYCCLPELMVAGLGSSPKRHFHDLSEIKKRPSGGGIPTSSSHGGEINRIMRAQRSHCAIFGRSGINYCHTFGVRDQNFGHKLIGSVMKKYILLRPWHWAYVHLRILQRLAFTLMALKFARKLMHVFKSPDVFHRSMPQWTSTELNKTKKTRARGNPHDRSLILVAWSHKQPIRPGA